MMSKNSYSDKRQGSRKNGTDHGALKSLPAERSLRQQYLKDVRMPVIVTAVLFVLYHIVGTALYLSTGESLYAEQFANGYVEESSHAEFILSRAENLLGFGGEGTFVTFFAAALLGIYGYRWLLDRKSVDFYESQPVARRKRFFMIMRTGWAVFLSIYAVTALLGFLVILIFASGAGAGNVALSMLAQFVNCAVLFFASYAVAILAVMLTGRPVVTVLAACVLYFYEMALRLVITTMESTFFSTYSASGGTFRGMLLACPIYNAMQGTWAPVAENAVYGAVVLVLAYLSYRMRPNEAAGCAVVFRPVRAVVKVAIAFLAGITAALLASEPAAAGIAMGIIAAFLVSCVMEWIYTFNFRNALNHFPETLTAVGLSVFVLVFFVFDISGYDRWVPSESSVESAAILGLDGQAGNYNDDGEMKSSGAFSAEYMKLTDVGDVISLAEYCIERDKDTETDVSADSVGSTTATILYRMKNGSIKRRSYTVPYDVDADLMDRITGTEEYREGTYQVFHDGFFTKGKGDTILYYSTDLGGISATADYEEFRKACLKDLEKLDFSYALSHSPLGTVEALKTIGNDQYTLPFVVYEGFDETIAYLKKNGLYVDSVSADNVRRIEVTYTGDLAASDDGRTLYADTSDSSASNADSSDTGSDAESADTQGTDEAYSEVTGAEGSQIAVVDGSIIQKAVYTDPQQIEEILKHLVNPNLSGSFSWAVPTDPGYTVDLVVTGYGTDQQFLFRLGEVPDFVKSGTI